MVVEKRIGQFGAALAVRLALGPAPNVTYWYYCRNPAGYYPYVPSCPTPWQPVQATPN
jgi:hypothetical protein